ncbi:PepSY domain-containing protein [Hoyosella rhizosphaerae]|uniref:Peptidase n=1 Tax=Hoyosella rhizosphaerae TaxID=1755582 RepID=A0A916U8U6_9ACTN|nr:PepSY domain-containing protein [Hoyosella rhizosphaerae]MBN4927569.1 PepSY domain-containing protein [Hoyosella rhizosphaerae]GGC63441.1 peptidase [Hoyosella rhizosphaerae]
MSLFTGTVVPGAGQPPSRRTASKRSFLPLLLRLHFYAGIFIAPFLLVAAVTGGAYAIAPTIERFVYSEYLAVQPDGLPASVDEQVAAAVAAIPNSAVHSVVTGSAERDTTRIIMNTDDGQQAVFVDPYSADVVGILTVDHGALPLSAWLGAMHKNLHLGDAGALYSELAASWLWIVALGGLALWITRVRKGRKNRFLTVDRSAQGRGKNVNWHGVTGVWILLGLLFLSATGLTWSNYAGENIREVRSALNWTTPALDTGAPADAHDHGGGSTTVPNLDAIIDVAESEGINAPLEVTLPTEAGQSVAVAESVRAWRFTRDSVAVDPATLTVTDSVNFQQDYSVAAKLTTWGIRAHMGTLFGLANQIALLAVAIGLVTVIVRGYVMWWQRRPLRGSRYAVGKAPRRGALRSLPPVGIGAVLVTAVVVGYAVPLFGASLVAFVVVDTFVSVVRRR